MKDPHRQGRPSPVPRVLAIAGSDSGGGAGLQADLKTFQELETYGTCVVTALTAQNSLGVQRVSAVPATLVADQLESVLADIGTDAAKTGMLPTADIVAAVASAIRRHGVDRLVVDPVRTATAGTALVNDEAFGALRDILLPLAALVTPNVPEACALLGVREDEVRTLDERESAARALLGLGPRAVLLKGGHAAGDECVDVLVGADGGTRFFAAPRLPTRHTHGTGCTLAAAAAACLARGHSAAEACGTAKAFVAAAIARAVPLGRGAGPLWHAAWREPGIRGSAPRT
ncbi:bifunctional hydroxymethylpyrimidine kinase/phosphomethylpyrimidine kinase [Cohnella nanjingensis]|uniref:Hydroxymethylpyrimidine/phosphomethylpyrimidine kinase n=1 Tax=Cohnella nanjingensis TaxID=1387779 RepID=A0A7X0RNY3_9BACL|nr:bifunctional hydroxymethylpyrimidine kinase/phosphomethylpyrimidine kinase [Cohnella nanjingensis]MBB6669720.1 bifunctional hydroxymethylpyrimidine kinase/phosphomethylpyrimidine kinase [Cohnella nanjingensis]